jgi:hypothetical protein
MPPASDNSLRTLCLGNRDRQLPYGRQPLPYRITEGLLVIRPEWKPSMDPVPWIPNTHRRWKVGIKLSHIVACALHSRLHYFSGCGVQHCQSLPRPSQHLGHWRPYLLHENVWCWKSNAICFRPSAEGPSSPSNSRLSFSWSSTTKAFS